MDNEEKKGIVGMSKNSISKLGNKNAEKWTPTTVIPRIDKMLDILMTDPEQFNFLGSLLVDQGLYLGIWSIWKRKFANNDVIISKMKVIDSIFESKIVELGMKGKLNPTLVIFSLKNNYGWKDKKEIDLQGAMSIGNMNNFIDDDENE